MFMILKVILNRSWSIREDGGTSVWSPLWHQLSLRSLTRGIQSQTAEPIPKHLQTTQEHYVCPLHSPSLGSKIFKKPSDRTLALQFVVSSSGSAPCTNSQWRPIQNRYISGASWSLTMPLGIRNARTSHTNRFGEPTEAKAKKQRFL